MKKKYTQFISFVLAAVMLLGLVPQVSMDAAAAEKTVKTETLIEAIRSQIQAYADSIDQTQANTTAAQALANHGLAGKGKLLSVGEDHALTATLMNSELLQVALTEGCARGIEVMNQTVLSTVQYFKGSSSWYGADDSRYDMYTGVLGEDGKVTASAQMFAVRPYTGPRNAYDESLDWMAASTNVILKLERVSMTQEEAVYDVSCKISDRFDFSTNGNAGFKDFASGLGALFFREFNWEATTAFQLTVPYSCTHTTGVYRWIYDAENKAFTSDGTNGYQPNGVTGHTRTSGEKTAYYYELDKTVRLYHDRPWVLEYDVRNSGNFALAPYRTPGKMTPFLRLGGRYYLSVQNIEGVEISAAEKEAYDQTSRQQNLYHYYGTLLNKRFTYPSNMLCTFRLENVINSDGSNMIYVTASNTETGEVLLDHVPMDGYFLWKSWSSPYRVDQTELTDWVDGGGWVSGKDLYINYIGNATYAFSAGHFEMRIWENGKDNAPGSYYKTEVTEPTCTEQGYATRTCIVCGHHYDTDHTPAKGHSFGDWYTVTAAACTASGQERRDCAVCGTQETQEIAPLGHQYADTATAPTCTDKGYTTHTCTLCGDSYVDSETAASGHSFGAWTTTAEASCTASGAERRECTVCGHSESRETAALGHSAVVDAAVAPSCEATGLTEGSHCDRCGSVLTAQETVPAAGHQFADELDTICDICGFEREAPYLPGDADNSGTVDFFDAMLILQYYAGLIDETQLNLKAANVDAISAINFFDGMLILQHYAGIIDLNQTA